MPSRSPADAQRERKRKNADAQAQFRQRRANYISSLEETVTKLEAVVLELQDSLRDAKTETQRASEDKRQLNTMLEQLRLEQRDREHEWRVAWQAKLPNMPFPTNGPVLPLPSSLPAVPASPRGGPNLPSCLDPNLRFGLNLKDRPQLPRYMEEGAAPFAFNAPVRQHIGSVMNTQGPKTSTTYSPGPSQSLLFRSGEDSHGSSQLVNSVPMFRRGVEGAYELPHVTHYADGATSTMSFLPRIPPVFTHQGDVSHSMAHNGRSSSPHSPHASPSSAATSASSHLHFLPEMSSTDAENMQGLKNYGPVALQDQPQAIAPYSLGDAGQLPGNRRPDPLRRMSYPSAEAYSPSHTHIPPLLDMTDTLRPSSPPMSAGLSSQSLQHAEAGPSRPRNFSSVQENSEGGSAGNARRRSSSPPMSNTLAVIKAQAFGAQRRNRTQKKRGNGYATKVALEALEARGLNLGLEPTNTLSSSHVEGDDEDGAAKDLSDMDPMET